VAGKPYNGYSSQERAAKYRVLKRFWAAGEGPSHQGSCMLCGDSTSSVEPHSEDYAKPYRWEPPAMYWLCRHCHRAKLHNRFSDPIGWEAFKAHVRRGGYASDLQRYGVRREVERYRDALVAGKPGELPKLRESPEAHGTPWWELLSVDERTLTDRSARPRADDSEAPV
jgi:hypothetical protein